MHLDNKVIIVAGASSGIGYQVCLLAARKGAKVAATARRQHLLDKLKREITEFGGTCEVWAADALDENKTKEVVEAAYRHFGVIDIALLNIGEGPSFNLSKCSSEDILRNMRINYDSLVHYLVPLIHLMKQQRGGLIAHTNSLAGFIGLPMQGPYSAAKAAGRMLIDTSRIELDAYSIKFLSLYPGFVATAKVADDGVPAPFEIPEDKAAKYIVYAMEREKTDYLFPFVLRWLIRVARILPKKFLTSILKTQIPSDY